MPYLYDELVRYCGSDAYPFHMPGHKRRLGQLNDPFSFDITEIDGFDNLHHAEGILLEAEKRAARLYGAEETHFLVNGSTAGILSAIGAVTTAGGHLLMMRASHKAAYHAVAAGGLTAHYLSGLCGGSAPHIRLVGGFGKRTSSDGAEPGRSQADGLTELDCGQPADPAEVERALAEDPRIQAVYITSPTYDGIVSDVRAIAEIAHRHGIPLIVDEAHGAHFREAGGGSGNPQCAQDPAIADTDSADSCTGKAGLPQAAAGNARYLPDEQSELCTHGQHRSVYPDAGESGKGIVRQAGGESQMVLHSGGRPVVHQLYCDG